MCASKEDQEVIPVVIDAPETPNIDALDKLNEDIKSDDSSDIIKKVYDTEKLKQENYESMTEMDSNKQLDPSLKIGTGDDELVDQIVKSAKTGMGVVGTFIPDQVVSDAVKQKPPV